ncbi:MAG: hypothetical protein MZV63_17130 [Marinilabiliales bacterium]|nr:hypothetical protein [Marinilabiliales bacterium]
MRQQQITTGLAKPLPGFIKYGRPLPWIYHFSIGWGMTMKRQIDTMITIGFSRASDEERYQLYVKWLKSVDPSFEYINFLLAWIFPMPFQNWQ